MLQKDLFSELNGTEKVLAKELEAVYKTVNCDLYQTKITGAQDASNYLRKVFPVDITHREAFMIICLSRSNETLGHVVIGVGGISSTIADGKVIFQHALLANASAIILCHNHPSGNTNPSRNDDLLTENLSQFGKLIDLPVLDHVILTEDSYYSYADSGKL
jgi:DNA repair protein RadC